MAATGGLGTFQGPPTSAAKPIWPVEIKSTAAIHRAAVPQRGPTRQYGGNRDAKKLGKKLKEC